MTKKRLLILHPYLTPYRIDLYNQFNSDYDVKVLVYARDKEKTTLGYDLKRIEDIAKFKYVKISHGLYIGRHLISSIYYKVVREFRPNIVLSHELGVNTLAMIWLKRIFGYKLYTTFDDSPTMAVSYSGKRELLRNYVLSHIDGVILVSPDVRDYLEKKYIGKKCRYLFFPIVQDDKILGRNILLSSNKSHEYIKRYNLEGKKIVLFVGRQIAVKRPDVLVRVFAEIDDKESVLVLVGSGVLEKNIRKYISSNNLQNRIIQVGSLSGESLYAWYYLAHLFVLPSIFEPFGAVVNEALVAGCRVLVSDKVGASSLVNSANGQVFSVDSKEYFKQALSEELSMINIEKNIESRMFRSFDDYYKDLKQFIQ